MAPAASVCALLSVTTPSNTCVCVLQVITPSTSASCCPRAPWGTAVMVGIVDAYLYEMHC
eukprot:1152376-Pelagomonas_calceolata.AAC.1